MSKYQFYIVAPKLVEGVFKKRLEPYDVVFIELSGSMSSIFLNYVQFSRLLTQHRFDAIHFHIYHSFSLVYLLISYHLNIPIRIAHAHNSGLRSSVTRPLKMALHNISKRFLSKFATHLWGCSTEAVAFMFHGRVLTQYGYELIFNGVNTEKFKYNPSTAKEIRKNFGFQENNLVLGHVGRLTYQKNQKFLLDCFSYFLKLNPNGKLILVGTGEDYDILQQKVKDYDIGDHVFFLGEIANVNEILWAIDVFVFPSFFEGLAVTLVEAQASGLPIISSDRISNESILSPDFLQLPLEAGAETWAQKISTYVPSQVREQGALYVRSAGFDNKIVANKIIKHYSEPSLWS